jgi:hypothetical protein
VGTGSASLIVADDTEGRLVSAREFLGVPISDFETLEYSTYVTSSEGTAPSFQLGVSRTGTEQPLYGGRLVFVPSASAIQAVIEDEWQTWDVLDPAHGEAWFLTRDFNDPNNNTCRGGFEICTLAEILVLHPNISINPIGNPVGNAGAGWGIIGALVASSEGAVNANVDAFVVKQDGATDPITVFSFETAVAERSGSSGRGRKAGGNGKDARSNRGKRGGNSRKKR